jgi:hypothetical protein
MGSEDTMIYTQSGLSASEMVALGADTGIYPIVTGEPLVAAPINKTWKDLQAATKNMQLPGTMLIGSFLNFIVAIGLDITIRNTFRWYAHTVWELQADYIQSVADDEISWIWGCKDGVIRVTTGDFADADAPYPDDMGYYDACLFCKVTAADGVAIIDPYCQMVARIADGQRRKITDSGVFSAQPSIITEGMVCVVPADHQLKLYSDSPYTPFRVEGALIINGRVKVEVW